MIEIIPAIDLMDGKCVRLTHGDFARRVTYSDDPVAMAQSFEQAGVRRLHMVDLDGAREREPRNLSVLERVAAATGLAIDYGGGLGTTGDVESVFAAGASIVNIGSVAAKDPELFFGWLDRFGSDRILLGADVRSGKIAINGWQADTNLNLMEFLKSNRDRGVRQAFVTDISKDGAMVGPAVELYRSIAAELPDLQLIASGGVTCFDDIIQLDQAGCAGAIVGKAIYDGAISLKEIAAYVG